MFCKNCGNKLDDSDKVCAVCGETVDEIRPAGTNDVREKTMEKQAIEAKLAVDEDIKTPLFNFKWNVQDFPKEEEAKTEDIDFKWEPSKDSRVVEEMKSAVDAEKIANTPSFTEEAEKVEPASEEWYEPFAIKKGADEDTMFKFNKKNEEFQELLDKEFEKYNSTRQRPPVDVNTKRYNIGDFEAESEKEASVNILKPEEVFEQQSSTTQQADSIPVVTPTREDTKPAVEQAPPVAPAGVGIFDETSASPFGDDSNTQTTPVESKAQPSFASPFGDDGAVDDDVFLKDLPEGEEKKTVGPEVVNKPVVFPFEMEQPSDGTPAKPEEKPKEPVKKEEPATPIAPAKPAVSNEQAKVQTKISPTEPKKKEGNGLIKALVAVIVIIVILLGAIGVMKFLPDSMLGMAMNNFAKVVFNTGSGNEAKTLSPNEDLDAVIKTQLSVNRNIKQIPYDDSVGFDEKANYEISGANESLPIENNYWKKDADGDVLFDEQAVRSVIGYNSTWVGYINDGYNDVFNYVVEGSNTEKALKDEQEKLKKGTTVEFVELGIGEVRQNGNRFYVWTKETIIIKSSGSGEKKATIKQLYELETASDTLRIRNVAEL